MRDRAAPRAAGDRGGVLGPALLAAGLRERPLGLREARRRGDGGAGARGGGRLAPGGGRLRALGGGAAAAHAAGACARPGTAPRSSRRSLVSAPSTTPSSAGRQS